jgi:hypothetical protein
VSTYPHLYLEGGPFDRHPVATQHAMRNRETGERHFRLPLYVELPDNMCRIDVHIYDGDGKFVQTLQGFPEVVIDDDDPDLDDD